MMDEIQGGVLAAARVGWQVGRDMQIDRIISQLQARIDTMEGQRKEAWAEARNQAQGHDNALAKIAEEQEKVRQLKRRESELLKKIKELEAQADNGRRMLSEEREGSKKRKKQDDQYVLDLKAWAHSEIERMKKAALQQRENYRGAFAQGQGERQILQQLTAEIKSEYPSLRLKLLDEGLRERIRSQAWREVHGPVTSVGEQA